MISKEVYYFFYTLLLSIITIYPTEYVYPVASLDDENTIFFIHQVSSKQINLFEWNTKNNTVEQPLWSLYNPANVRLLTDKSGFSFIDNGRLRIQQCNKRSAKAIDFDIPLCNITITQWIDKHSCYGSAQCGDHYAIFQFHSDGRVKDLVFSDSADCLYPQKVGSYLFYIVRTKCNNHDDCAYNIIKTTYKTGYKNLDNKNNAQSIICFGNRPIIFLDMQSPKEGFVIEHPKTIESDEKTITFLYHQIMQHKNLWKQKLLFSFDIPSSLLMGPGDDRLYESILPLLPRAINNKVYFVSCNNSSNDCLEAYCYDLATHHIIKCNLPDCQGHWFSPMVCGKKICFGGTKQKNISNTSSPFYFLT